MRNLNRRSHQFLNMLFADVRVAVRRIRANPALTLWIVLILGIGIGLTTVVFGLVDVLMFRAPSGVGTPERVVRIYVQSRQYAAGQPSATPITTYPTFEALRDHASEFAQVAAVSTREVPVGLPGDEARLRISAVSYQYFALLQVQALAGRVFDSTDDRRGAQRVLVLTRPYWERVRHSDRDIIGKEIRLANGSYIVIGVTAGNFAGIDLTPSDGFVPIQSADDAMVPQDIENPGSYWVQVIGRLQQGVDIRHAGANATSAYRTAQQQLATGDSSGAILLGSIQEARGPTISAEASVSSWVAATAALVLLIACINVSYVLLAKSAERRAEFAVRISLGARSIDLARLVFTEAAILAVTGGVAAVLVAALSQRILQKFLIPGVTGSAAHLDGRTLLIAIAVVCGTAMASGILPALRSSDSDLSGISRAGREGSKYSGRTGRSTLVIAQVSITTSMLLAAGLFVRSFQKVQMIDLGFDVANVVALQVDQQVGDDERQSTNHMYVALAERIRRMAGVIRVAGSMGMPLADAYGMSIRAQGSGAMPKIGNTGGPYYQVVTPDYFATIGTRLLRGRSFNDADRSGAARVAIVNETLATLMWPEGDPTNQCVFLGSLGECVQIIGVVVNSKRSNIMENKTPMIYLPFAQADIWGAQLTTILIRMKPGASIPLTEIRHEIRSFGSLPQVRINGLGDILAPQTRLWSVGASLLTTFGVLALIIATLGVFASLSLLVTRQTPEIGLRLALGARPLEVVRIVVIHGLGAVAIGIVFGIGIGYVAALQLAPMLYKVAPADPLVLSLTCAAIFASAAAASYVPARRAANISPLVAMRGHSSTGR